MENQKWQAYGDVNPIPHGGQWIRPQFEGSTTQFEVVTIQSSDDDECFYVDSCSIDIEDSWIKWKDVTATMDTPENDPLWQALDAIKYYGCNNFGSDCPTRCDTAEDAQLELARYEIQVEI